MTEQRGILWGVVLTPLKVERFFPCGQPHHITLKYDVERDRYADWLGSEFMAAIQKECWNHEVQALRVQVPKTISCKENPHITVSWADGAAPVASNWMLAGEHNERAIAHPLIVCRIEFQAFKGACKP